MNFSTRFQHRLVRIQRAFTLTEVVIAMGIASVALVTILGLLSSTTRLGRDVYDQDFAVQASKALNVYLEKEGFTKVYGWLQSPASMPALFIFMYEENGTMRTIVTNKDDSTLNAMSSKRVETLLNVKLEKTTDMVTTGSDGKAQALNASAATPDAYPEAAIPMRVRLYRVGDVNGTPLNENLQYTTLLTLFR